MTRASSVVLMLSLLALNGVACGAADKDARHRAPPVSAADTKSYEFVRDVLRCLRLSRDTKNNENTIERPANDREKGFLFAERLEHSGREIQGIMVPWQSSQEPRIAEVASHLHTAGRDLQEMASACREILRGNDSDEHAAAFKARKEDLTDRFFSAASLAANRDSTKTLVLTAEQKQAIVSLIETQLFTHEMQEYDQTPDDLKESYVTQPDLFAVLAFRNVYKREIGVK